MINISAKHDKMFIVAHRENGYQVSIENYKFYIHIVEVDRKTGLATVKKHHARNMTHLKILMGY